MPLINLHNHSTYSDGTLTPKALALEAARAGIEYFSLTDHDTIDGWPEMGLALDGIEAFYPAHSPEDTKKLIALVAKHELFVTAGCDLHGPPFERCVMSGFEYPDEYFTEIKDLFL